MKPIDVARLAAVTGGAPLLAPTLRGAPTMRRPPQLPPVIRGPCGGVPLVIPAPGGGPPFIIKGPPVGPCI
jgi:hypothetical protein